VSTASASASASAPIDREQLARDFLPLALATARRLRGRYPRMYRDRHAALSDALYALALAVRDYDPGRGVHFATFYARVAIWKVLRYAARDFDRQAWPRGTVQLDGGRFPDPDPRQHPPWAALADDEAARAILAPLTPREAEALWLTTVEGLYVTEAGPRMGVSPQRVAQLVAVARGRLNPATPAPARRRRPPSRCLGA
jgi:RNA polymerase sigma factor (sigma-70 family)